jgi:hypothetical protein
VYTADGLHASLGQAATVATRVAVPPALAGLAGLAAALAGLAAGAIPTSTSASTPSAELNLLFTVVLS